MSGFQFSAKIFFLIMSISFGTLFVFLTPPIQVPDENIHFYRAYQLTDFDFLQVKQTIPASLEMLTKMSMDMFSFKNTQVDFSKLMQIQLKPEQTFKTWTFWYIIPYLPQSAGILIGRLLGAPPLVLLYLGRLFNLFFAIFLIYQAIRLIPLQKWTMVLLGLMPMSITQLASNSYDAMAIGLAFLSIAYFLHLKFASSAIITKKEFGNIFILCVLLGLCKPVYCCLGILFLVLPVNKIGSVKTYYKILVSLIIAMIIAPFSYSLLRNIVADDVPYEKVPWNNANLQLQFILHNFAAFLKTLFETCFIHLRTFYLDSFVGILGWLSCPLPKLLINSYLTILLISAVLDYKRKFKFNFKDKLIAFAIFTASVVAIELAIYLTWTSLGSGLVEGVQGRYFIPFSPLLFLVFFNNSLSKFFQRILTIVLNYTKYRNFSGIQFSRLTLKNRSIYASLAQVFIMLFVSGSLIITALTIYSKYY